MSHRNKLLYHYSRLGRTIKILTIIILIPIINMDDSLEMKYNIKNIKEM